MKAAYLVSPTNFEVCDVPIPSVPNDGLLIAVKACGVCGSDLRRWREGPATEYDRLVAGHEISGDIVTAGAHVKDYAIGERLAIAPDVHCGRCYYCEHGLYNLCDSLRFIGITSGYNGGFAEYLVLTAEMLTNGIVHRVPKPLTYRQAALAEPLSSVLSSHEQACTTLEDTVVVMGAGPIGCLHIAVARARGARVILSEPSSVRRQMALQFGPELIIDPTAQNLINEVRQATGGLGADIAICANPVAATHAQAVELVRKRGKVVLFGGLPKANPTTELDGNRIHYSEIRVFGSFSYHPSYHSLALDVIGRGLVNSEQVITHSFTIDKINQAFHLAANGEALKVMIESS